MKLVCRLLDFMEMLKYLTSTNNCGFPAWTIRLPMQAPEVVPNKQTDHRWEVASRAGVAAWDYAPSDASKILWEGCGRAERPQVCSTTSAFDDAYLTRQGSTSSCSSIAVIHRKVTGLRKPLTSHCLCCHPKVAIGSLVDFATKTNSQDDISLADIPDEC